MVYELVELSVYFFFFFKNIAGEKVTINGDCCRAIITNYLMTEIEAGVLSDMWFQRDGTTFYASHQSMDLLREHFDEQIISHFGPVIWPPRTCDATPLDFFL